MYFIVHIRYCFTNTTAIQTYAFHSMYIVLLHKSIVNAYALTNAKQIPALHIMCIYISALDAQYDVYLGFVFVNAFVLILKLLSSTIRILCIIRITIYVKFVEQYMIHNTECMY